MNWVAGPPASGKTTFLIEKACQVLQQRRRVWWVGLPNQRSYILQQAARAGAHPGLEFLTFQRLYYLLLAANLGLQPLLTGPGRVALTGEALLDSGPSPSPGEARLFARAIAEAKRAGLSPSQLPTHDDESRRLVRVYTRYEELRTAWGRWDYDDFRLAALRLLEGPATSWSLPPELSLIVLDGFRGLGGLELRVARALASRVDLWASLPRLIPGLEPRVIFSKPHHPVELHSYQATNEMAEVRWILRSLKQDLAQGLSPAEMAVIAPRGQIPGLLALGQEYGVPLADHAPITAADTPQGRLLLALLELPDHPRPAQLLEIPELADLGRLALEQGLAGRPALHQLAEQLGVADYWQQWLERLEPVGAPEVWAQQLLDSLPQMHGPARQVLLERAREAARIASGTEFRYWWASLVAQTHLPARPEPGIALLSSTLASGVRYEKVYLTAAIHGTYSPGEEEDYFIPEEFRLPEARARAMHDLPQRLQGLQSIFLQELISRGRTVVVSHARARPGSLIEPEPHLTGPHPQPLPELPAASLFELGHYTYARFSYPVARLALGNATLEDLNTYATCPFLAWARPRLGPPPPPGHPDHLIAEMIRLRRLDEARLQTLAQRYRELEGWLRAHTATLGSLDFGYALSAGQAWEAQVHAVSREGAHLNLYHFCSPEVGLEPRQLLASRWSEFWVAGHWLQAPRSPFQQVTLWVWELGQKPQSVYSHPGDSLILTRYRTINRQLPRLLERYQEGSVEPAPGFHCRRCRFADLCRTEPLYGR